MSAGVADWVPVGINSICSKIALTLTSAVDAVDGSSTGT
jgi:hypothetical protein